MAKFCGKCGAQLNDNATFCTNCGSPVQQAGQPQAQQNAAPAFNSDAMKNAAANAQAKISDGFNTAKDTVSTAVKTGDKKTLFIVGGIGVAILVVIIILLCLLFGGGSYKTPLDNFVKACEDGDGDALKDLLPGDFIDIIEDSKLLKKQFDFDDMAEDVKDDLEDEYGKKIKVSYKINDKEKLDEDELEDIEDTYNNYFAGLLDDDEEYKVKEGYDLDITFKIKGNEDDDEEDVDITVVKVNGDWVMSMDSFNKLS